jgi:hypothetical protein
MALCILRRRSHNNRSSSPLSPRPQVHCRTRLSTSRRRLAPIGTASPQFLFQLPHPIGARQSHRTHVGIIRYPTRRTDRARLRHSQSSRHRTSSVEFAARRVESLPQILQYGIAEAPMAFRELVIVHELLHLLVPNHGKLFKSLMSAYLPGWEKRCRRAAQPENNDCRDEIEIAIFPPLIPRYLSGTDNGGRSPRGTGPPNHGFRTLGLESPLKLHWRQP